MEKQLNLTEARKQFSELVNQVQYRGDNYIILKNGEPAAAVVPIKILEQWRAQRQALFDVVREVNRRNEDVDPDEVMQAVLEAQQATRTELSGQA